MLPSGFISVFPSTVINVVIRYLEPAHYYDFYCPARVTISESHFIRQDCFDFQLFYDMIKHICSTRYFVRLNSRELVICCTRSLLDDFHVIFVACINPNVLSAF